MGELIAALKPVFQLYKAETAAIGFAVASALCGYFGLSAEMTALVGTIVGYLSGYANTKPPA